MVEDLRIALEKYPQQGDVYENIIIDLYKMVLAGGGVGVDAGANTGWHTFGMAETSPAVRVYGYEPAPELFKILEARSHKYGDRMHVYRKALSKTSGVAKFNFFHEPDPAHPNYPLWNAGLSGLKSAPALLAKKGHQVLTVATTRLDDEFREDRFDFFKIDVEGGEFDVLQGSRATLRRHLPLIAFEDGGARSAALYDYTLADMYDFLANCGYDMFDILGKPYDAKNWAERSEWRPFYSVAVPRERMNKSILLNAVDSAVKRKFPPS